MDPIPKGNGLRVKACRRPGRGEEHTCTQHRHATIQLYTYIHSTASAVDAAGETTLVRDTCETPGAGARRRRASSRVGRARSRDTIQSRVALHLQLCSPINKVIVIRLIQIWLELN